MTHIQRFLDGKTPAEAIAALEEYGLRAVQGKRHENLYSLRYDIITADRGHPLVRECRGIVLDSANNWAVVARPFDRFFNFGDALADPIDLSTAKAYKKLDGSLMILYYYDGEWHVASSGTPDASGPLSSDGPYATFADLFWATFEEEGYSLPGGLWEEYTFIFEMTTPYNRVVVPHAEKKLTLLGVRHRDGTELSLESPELKEVGYRIVPSVPLSSIEDLAAQANKLDPLEEEGYIVCDASFRRVKIKGAPYVALHHMRDSFTAPRALDIVRMGEEVEVGLYFPEFAEQLDSLREQFESLRSTLEGAYERIRGIESQKEFAFEALKTPLPDCLFSVRKGTAASVEEYLRSCNNKRLAEALERQ